ncbi:hypothetical protein V8F33_013150 [Rhypophila sp. PSN 637]
MQQIADIIHKPPMFKRPPNKWGFSTLDFIPRLDDRGARNREGDVAKHCKYAYGWVGHKARKWKASDRRSGCTTPPTSPPPRQGLDVQARKPEISDSQQLKTSISFPKPLSARARTRTTKPAAAGLAMPGLRARKRPSPRGDDTRRAQVRECRQPGRHQRRFCEHTIDIDSLPAEKIRLNDEIPNALTAVTDSDIEYTFPASVSTEDYELDQEKGNVDEAEGDTGGEEGHISEEPTLLGINLSSLIICTEDG